MLEHFGTMAQNEEIFRRLRQVDEGITLPESLKAENLRYLMDQADEEMASHPREATAKVYRPFHGRWKGLSAAAAVLLVAAAVYWGQPFLSLGGSLKNGTGEDPAPAAMERAAVTEAAEEESTAVLGSQPAANAGSASFMEVAQALNQRMATDSTSSVSPQKSTAYAASGASHSQGTAGDVVQLSGEVISYYQPANYLREENTIYLVDSQDLQLLSTISVPDNTGVTLYGQGNLLAAVVEASQSAEEILYDETVYTPLSQLDEGGSLGGEAPAVFANHGATLVVVYDISDAENPKEQYRLTQDGTYFSSHVADGTLYLITSKETYTDSLLDETTPVCNAVPILKDDSTAIPMNPADISFCLWAQGDSYTVVSAVSLADSSRDTQAVVGNVQKTWQRQGNLYLALSAQEETTSQTALVRLACSGGRLTPAGDGVIALRADDALILEGDATALAVAGNCADYRTGVTTGTVLTLDQNLETVGRLALTQGTTIRTGILEGEKGTFILSDGTMASVDLSDPANLAQTQLTQLTSAPQAVVPFGEGRLLALGRNSQDGMEAGLRLTLLDSSTGEELAVMQLPGNATTSLAEGDSSLLLTLPEENLAAMPMIVKERTGSSSPKLIFWGYAIFSVNEKGISIKGTVSHGDVLDEAQILDQFQSVERGLASGRMLYTFSGSKIVATDLKTMENKYQLRLI